MTTNMIGVTTVTPKILASGRVATAAATTVYTVPTSTTTKVAQGSLTNTTGSAVTVSLSVVPSGQTVDGTHLVIDSFQILPHDTLPLKDYLAGVFLGPGDFISITPSAVTAITYLFTGVESS